MKTIILTLQLIVTISLALPQQRLDDVDEGVAPLFDGIRDTVFSVFTRQNPTNGQIMNINDMETVRNSTFDSRRLTKFLIHGVLGNGNSQINTVVRPAYLQAGDFNVIVVDWGSGAFSNPVTNSLLVGAAIAHFLDNLQDAGLIIVNEAEMIGHSQGANIAGFAGRKVRGHIGTIIGLDVADSGDANDPSTNLQASNALYVQIIQTEITFWGISVPFAHANFYPAGGTNQPNCEGNRVCDHMIASDYFAESLANPNRFYAQLCSSMDQMRANACPNSTTAYMMGGLNSRTNGLRGIFRLPVNAARPFAVGR